MIYKNTEDYEPSLYACYAITGIKEDFKIYTVHPSGLREYEHYDVYEIDNKTLIAFTKIRFLGTDFVFRIVSENHTEDISSENYEFLSDILDESYDQSNYVFSIMHSCASYREVVGDRNTYVEDSRRCDVDDFAAVNFQDIIPGEESDLLDENYFNNENIIGFALCLASMGNVYIVKLQLGEIQDRAYKDWSASTIMGQTFMHTIKMAYEWNNLAEEPWNSNQTIALSCNSAFKEWNMPQEVLDEISSISPSTSIEMYLSGDENPRRSIIENKTIPPNFKKWYMSQLRYRTVNSLVENYPEPLNIPQSMIDKEIQFFQNELLNYMIENNLDPVEVNSIQLLDYIFSSSAYDDKKNKNNSVDDIVLKYFIGKEEDQQLVKAYHGSMFRPTSAE
jgi:hypothetical protein